MTGNKDTTSVSDPAGMGLEAVGDGKMWLDCRFRPYLEHAGLADFETVMANRRGRCLRAMKDRENWRLELHNGHQQPRGLFLKKHHVRTWQSWLRAKMGAGPGETPGCAEARNVGRLAAEGVQVMGLVAYGQRLRRDGLLESFVLTEELHGYTELPRFLKNRFPAEGLLRAGPRQRDLERLIRTVAEVVRRLHQAGYNHRDLYACHFFLREPAPGQFEVKLIDLQRVQRRRWLRRRWLVKDLAQLAWSVPRSRIKCTHKLAFMRCYLGVRKLRPCDKRLIRQVLAKQQLMERKLGIDP